VRTCALHGKERSGNVFAVKGFIWIAMANLVNVSESCDSLRVYSYSTSVMKHGYLKHPYFRE